MRDRSSWRKDLVRQLKNVWPVNVPAPGGPALLCDTELALFLAESLAPGQPITEAWAVYTEYRYLEGLGISVSTQQRRMQQVAAHLLAPASGRRDWQRQLNTYLALPEWLRGWSISKDHVPIPRDPSAAPDRFDTYQATLAQAPPLRKFHTQAAPPGRYRVLSAREPSSVTIPSEFTGNSEVPRYSLTAREDRKPVVFTWEELRTTAEELDKIEAAWPDDLRGHWTQRFSALSLRVRQETGFVATEKFTIDGLLHLIGMVGSGKSTLMQLCTVAAAQAGMNVTLVLADVLSCLRLTVWFERLGITAAPIVGTSNRERHIHRLEQVHAEERNGDSVLAGYGPEHDLLSTACALDGLRQQPERPWGYHEAPCRGALAAPDNLDQRFSCPVASTCQRHRTSRDLVGAQVWLGTPAGLVASHVSPQVTAEQARYLELAWRRSDLIIVDEADAVQTQMDTLFSPSQTLFGAVNDSWLEELAEHVDPQLRTHRYGQFIDSQPVREWISALDVANSTVKKLFQLLPRDPLPRGGSVLRRILDKDFFTEWTLAHNLIQAWTGCENPADAGPAYNNLRTTFDQFLPDPLAEHAQPEDEAAAELVSIAHKLIGATTEENPRSPRPRRCIYRHTETADRTPPCKKSHRIRISRYQ